MRVPWTARRSNQSILEKINPEYSLESLMLKLKLQHFGHLMQRADSLEKTTILGNIEGSSRRERWLDGITDSVDKIQKNLRGSEGQRSPKCCSPWDGKELETT